MRSDSLQLDAPLRLGEKFPAAFEALLLAVGFVVYWAAIVLLQLAASAQIVCTALFLCGLLYLCWRNFNRGMHPVFLFLGLLLLFQGGGLLGYIFSAGEADPLQITLAEAPFDVSYDVKRITLLLLLLSAAVIYATLRLSGSRLRYEAPKSDELLPFLLLIFLIALPFHFWKNYEYFQYVRSHGGYLAIFRSEEHVSEVGVFVRAMSQLCSSAYIVYFVYERPRVRLALLSLLYIAVSTLELLIGLRGKVLLFFLCLLFLYKLKRGTGFRIRGLIVIAVALAITAQAVVIFRENKTEQFEWWKVPAMFLGAEGVSINETETIIGFYPQFAPYRWSYLHYGVLGLFQSHAEAQEMVPQGEVLADDSGMFLNPTGYALGFGPGGSYLAEGYLYGKAAGVIGESLLSALLLIWLAHSFRGWRIPFAWSAMVGLIYLPREDLMVAIPGILRSWAALALVFAAAGSLAALVRWSRQYGEALSGSETPENLRP
ncbi:MAG TPA: O-antigen polysaccharide polymerase Wzy [Candidatus Koribacter sp.]|jgi:hypothetical protein